MKIDSDTIFDIHEYGICVPTRELFLHRYIHTEAESTGDCGIDHRMAVMLVKNLRLLDITSEEPITIHMQSRGGDEQDGYAIYDAIKASKSYITCIAYAHARSMTGIILQAANKRIMMPSCLFLAHYGWISTGEDRVQPVLSQMDFTKQQNDRMLEVYADRCKNGEFFRGQHRKTIIDFIKKKLEEKTDWILTPEQAVHYGFADGVLGQRGF